MKINKSLYLSALLISLLSLSSCNANKNKPITPDEPVVPVDPHPGITIEDGKAIERYDFTPCDNASYSNKNSSILRFTVYIETDYDTDLDGNNDLIKAFVQVPKEVVEKGYKVANIIQASPYTTGACDDDYHQYMGEEGTITDVDISKPGKSREITEKVDLLEYANNIDTAEFYFDTGKGAYGYSEMYDNDYFLVRGFAYINVAGYGGYMSDGLQIQGSRLELHPYECVIDWLNNRRTAFTDREGTNTIDASFSNGNCAATGCSYLGTTAYELATSGIEGLKTIHPQAGIASWYDYCNEQGASLQAVPNTPWLSNYCYPGRYSNSETINEKYSKYLKYMEDSEASLEGDYGDYWASRDFTKNIDIKCPALIYHGINDFNVKIKHGFAMYHAYKQAGVPVKMILHQGNHMVSANGPYAFSIDEYQSSLYDLLNKWYCHYLYDVTNDVESLSEITYQSNIDGKFYTLDNLTDYQYKEYALPSPTITTVTSEGQKTCAESYKDEQYTYGNKNKSVFDLGEVEEDTLIKGTPKLSINLSTKDVNRGQLNVSAFLVDTSTSYFNAYGCTNASVSYGYVSGKTFDYIGGAKKEYFAFNQTRTKAKVISYASFDLSNPGSQPLMGSTPTVNLESDQSYNYTINLSPVVYQLLKGHVLKLVLATFDPQGEVRTGNLKGESSYEYKNNEVNYKPYEWGHSNPYSYTIDMSSNPTLSIPQ